LSTVYEYKTLLLERSHGDLCLDSSGNIAVATAPYSLAQDVASAIKTFLGELYYDKTQGVAYWADVFGQMPPFSLIQQLMVNAALTVSGVISAQVIVTSFTDRTISGQVQFTDASGETGVVIFD
jgi:hypothetical protein